MNARIQLGMEDDRLEDFVDPGMHMTCLVQDTGTFSIKPGPTSERDRTLQFGITYEEWVALYFDVLDVDHGAHKRWAKSHPDEADNTVIPEFQGEIENYPMLSRICGFLYDAIFEADEVEQLRLECNSVQVSTSNEVARRGLNKLLLICRWAQTLNLSIYLMCN